MVKKSKLMFSKNRKGDLSNGEKRKKSKALPALAIIGLVGLGLLPQSLGVEAATTSGDYTYETNSDGTVTITDYLGASKAVTIPSTLDGKEVTMLGDDSFYRDNLTSVTIPDTVNEIGDNAFKFNLLTEVVIPEGVEKIDTNAFTGMGGSVNISGKSTKYDGNSITKLSLPSTLKEIGAGAFYGNGLAGEITIPEGVEIIGGGTTSSLYGAFESNKLTKVNLPSSLKEIRDKAFRLNSLQSLELPDGLELIGTYAFYANSLTGHLTVPDSVKTIGDYAFSDNGSKDNRLETLKLSESLTSLGNSVFSKNQLKEVTLPKSLTSLGESAFATNVLTDVIVEGELSEVGANAFNGNQLTKVPFDLSSLSTIDAGVFQNNAISEDIVIPENITSVGSKSFGNNNIAQATIESATTRVESDAFDGNKTTASDFIFFAPDPSVAKTLATSKGYTFLAYTKPAPEPTPEPENPETGGEGSEDGSVDVGTGTEGGSSLPDSSEDKATFGVINGGLALNTSAIKTFGDIPLADEVKTFTTSFEDSMSVRDFRGTQEGWRVDVSATPFEVVEPEGGFKEGTEATVLPTGTLSMNPLESIEPVGTSTSELPAINLSETTPIDNGKVTIVTAVSGTGTGEYNLVFPEDALALKLDPATLKTDMINYPESSTPYESTVTFDIVEAP